MKVMIYGEAFECERAEKGPDFVRLYDGEGALTAAFSGIRDFDGYRVEGGGWAQARAEADHAAFLAGLMEGYGDA